MKKTIKKTIPTEEDIVHDYARLIGKFFDINEYGQYQCKFCKKRFTSALYQELQSYNATSILSHILFNHLEVK